MDVVGSEIGQKMRSAIKAKLTELGCYVDDELPDYVMVMVANKRTRAQMEDDLQLFLGDNTELFVNWLHQVLKKLQEVTVTAPTKPVEQEKSKQKSHSKDPNSKEQKIKDKPKKSDGKKAKKKDKQKSSRKKNEKKVKSKKKTKHHDVIRPNIPPLLMNIEKQSEPSITDVFAGQILKNHGISLDVPPEPVVDDKKTIDTEIKRPVVPIIDPETIQSQADSIEMPSETNTQETERSNVSSSSIVAPKEEQIREINAIEAKIQGLKQKLVEQLDSMSDDEDFLNIRTEAEELMNDFAEDVFQEISQQAPPASSLTKTTRSSSLSPPSEPLLKPVEIPKESPKVPTETLPQIELKLPKRSIRERLGVREEPKTVTGQKGREVSGVTESPERFTPEREPEFRLHTKSGKRRLSPQAESQKRHSGSEETSSDKSEFPKRLTSKVSVLENRGGRAPCASVVRVRPRPRASAPAPALLLRAVADAHKSLLNIPPKMNQEPHQVKRALVLPMRRVDAQKIVIQVSGADAQRDADADAISLGDPESEDEDKSSKVPSDTNKNEYIPISITKKVINNDYTPSRRNEARTATKRDDTLIIETINIHNPSVDKDKNTQFIVTMDGYHPNAFLAKKLLTEGLLSDEGDVNKTKNSNLEKDPSMSSENSMDEPKERMPGKKQALESTSTCDPIELPAEPSITSVQNKLLSYTNESDTQFVLKEEDNKAEKRKHVDMDDENPPEKKRKSSPIVFDVGKKEKEEKARERTESVSSDNQVVVTTTTNTHKYDALPPLSVAERKPLWCRAFPQCRYGAACAFLHPRCKFAAACTRRNCVYSHVPPIVATPIVPSIASHVVPAANYKSISTVTPSMCKYYPNCVNPACHYYHPKPCRYGKVCTNKLECNFYHADVPSKWRYTV